MVKHKSLKKNKLSPSANQSWQHPDVIDKVTSLFVIIMKWTRHIKGEVHTDEEADEH